LVDLHRAICIGNAARGCSHASSAGICACWMRWCAARRTCGYNGGADALAGQYGGGRCGPGGVDGLGSRVQRL
jgi:hypothetical protein